jgi:hypothetical protein
MAEYSGRSVCFMLAVSFVSGVILGYKIKSWRIKYLQAKRDYFKKKVFETQRQIDVTSM